MKKKLLTLALFTAASLATFAQKIDFTGGGNSAQTTYSIDPTNGFTIEYYMYMNNLMNFNGTVSQGNANQPGPIDVYINGAGQMAVLYGDGNVNGGGNPPYTFEAKKWYHIAHTYNPSTSSGNLYVNGSLITTFNAIGSMASTNSILFMATRDDDATNADIKMKDLKVWSGERTPTMDACLTGSEANLLIYYKMDEGSGTTLNDLATADGAQNATLVGTVNWSSLQTPSVSVSANQNPAFYGTSVTYNSTITGDILVATYQWYKNNTPVGTDSSAYTDSTPTTGDSVYVSISSSVPCLTVAATPSNKIGMTVYSINYVPYTTGCYDVGNLEFCEPLYYDYNNYYVDGNGITGTAIDEGTILSTGQSDAYDGAFEIAVDDTAFTYVDNAYVDTAKKVIQTSTQWISGLKVSKEFHVMKNMPIIRANVQLHNPTSSAKTVRVNIASNFGSDGGTVLDSSSTDSTTISNRDRWIITHDQRPYPSNDPVITSVRFGPGAIASQPHFKNRPENGDDYYDDSVNVTIPAHSTRYVVMFNRLDTFATSARAHASYFNDVPTMVMDSLFSGIDTMANIVNWSFVKPVANFNDNGVQTSCDSVTVTFTNNSTNTDSVEWNFGDGSPVSHATNPSHTYAGGTYTVTLTAVNADGYTNLVSTSVSSNPQPLDLTTSLSGAVITSNQAGATYQWLDCNGNTVLAGETNQSYTATATGNYKVIVSMNGCVDTSNCVAVNTTGITNHFSSVKLYPNPASNQVTIVLNGAAEGATLEMLDVMGRMIYSEKASQTSTIDISNLTQGLYQVRIVKEGKVLFAEKLIKQ